MENNEIYVGITGVGGVVGEIDVDNKAKSLIIEQAVYEKRIRAGNCNSLDEVERSKLLTNPDWILTRTGIESRPMTTKGTSYLATRAARVALDNAGCSKDKIDFVLIATVSPDYRYSPPTASLVHRSLELEVKNGLGLKHCLSGDFSNACTSFGTLLILGYSLIKSGVAKCGLIIGADRMTSTVDPAGRGFSSLVSDAAGAFVLEAVNKSLDSFPFGPAGFFSGTDPSGACNIIARMGGSAEPLTLEALEVAEANPYQDRPDTLWQNGAKVRKEVTYLMAGIRDLDQNTVIGQALLRAKVHIGDIDWLFPHQANLRINEDIEERLVAAGFKKERVYNTITKVGNATSAAIPYGVYHAWETGKLRQGEILMLAPFGGGYTWATALVRWTTNSPWAV